ncbi:MAG: GatB/YqeY domain-containing protein [Chloroflexota bacterium]
MSLKEQLTSDLTVAMRAGDTKRRDVLRMMLAAVKQTEVDTRTTLDDVGVQDVLRKQLKQRQESITDYQKAGRQESVDDENAEIAIIETYLPQLMTREEIETTARNIIDEMGVTDPKDMGQVMSRLMPELKGRADGRLVSDVVRSLLS